MSKSTKKSYTVKVFKMPFDLYLISHFISIYFHNCMHKYNYENKKTKFSNIN